MASPAPSGKWYSVPDGYTLQAIQRAQAQRHDVDLVRAMRALAEAEDASDEVKSVVPIRESREVPHVPVKIPVPAHLLKGPSGSGRSNKGRKASTNPVRKRGKGRWRDVTAGNVADYGYKAWQLAKHLATLVNVEEKKWDVDGSSGLTVTSTASCVNLSNIAQGVDYFNRTGDSILGQTMELRATLRGSTAVPNNRARILVVCDHDNRGSDPVIGDVLQGGSNPFEQPYNALSGNRFSVLYDEHIELINVPDLSTAGTSTAYIPGRFLMPILKRKWNKHIKYIGTTGADASNYEGALFLFAISADPTYGPVLTYTFRLCFTDN